MTDKSMKEAYGDALLELADDETVVILDADLAKVIPSINFAKNYLERFFDTGISEQNLMGAATGAAVSGLKPYVPTLAMFAVGRASEQVRNAICYAKEGVRIAATHAGLSPDADGGSHETIEDTALMRVLPGMTVLNPCDYNQAKTMIKQTEDIKTPSYIRLPRHPVSTVTKPDIPLQTDVINVLRDGADVCTAATGIMAAEACSAAEQLKEKGTDAAVLNIHTIKPLDGETILRYTGKCPLMVTAEEHSVIGGLDSAICEVTAGSGLGCQVSRMGIRDRLGQSDDLQELMNTYELTASHTVSRVIQLAGWQNPTRQKNKYNKTGIIETSIANIKKNRRNNHEENTGPY